MATTYKEPVRVGINGFGDVGRWAFHEIRDRYGEQIKVVAINDADIETDREVIMAALLARYQGELPSWLNYNSHGGLSVDGVYVWLSSWDKPELIPWDNYGVQIVVDCTGKFSSRDKAFRHLHGGTVVKKVICVMPAEDMDMLVRVGTDHMLYKPESQHLIGQDMGGMSTSRECGENLAHLTALVARKGWEPIPVMSRPSDYTTTYPTVLTGSFGSGEGGKPPMATCPVDDEPLVATLEFDGFEFICVVCDEKYGFFAPKPATWTQELQTRYDELQERYLAEREKRQAGS